MLFHCESILIYARNINYYLYWDYTKFNSKNTRKVYLKAIVRNLFTILGSLPITIVLFDYSIVPLRSLLHC